MTYHFEEKPCRKCGVVCLTSDESCDLPGLCEDCLIAALWAADPEARETRCAVTGVRLEVLALTNPADN